MQCVVWLDSRGDRRTIGIFGFDCTFEGSCIEKENQIRNYWKSCGIAEGHGD